jgi:hypothetical protein
MRSLALSLLVLVLTSALGCTPTEWKWQAELSTEELLVRSDLPIHRIEIRGEDGGLVAIRRLSRPLNQVGWKLDLPGTGALQVIVDSRMGRRSIQVKRQRVREDFHVLIEAPLGQEVRTISGGETIYFPAVKGSETQVAVQLISRTIGTATLSLCGRESQIEARVKGELIVVTEAVPTEKDCEVLIRSPGEETRFVLHPDVLELEQARDSVRVERIVFPADARGQLDPGRREGRVTLPSPALEELLRSSPLGVHSRAMESPWGHQAIQLSNKGDKGLNAVIRTTVTDQNGQPAPAFRSRVRKAETLDGAVSALIRIPANGEEIATLPLFVDSTKLPPGAGTWTRKVEVIPLGSDAPLFSSESPLYVSRASSWSAVGFVAVIISMTLGFILLLLRLGSWLRRSATSELVTVALFANLMFLFSAASHVLGLSVTSVLGPFATLVTGLVDDVFRYALLATLVTLLPRPGIVTLTLLVHTVMRTLALGGFHPVLPFMLGSTVLWLEGCLWVAGITRGDGAWRDESPRLRWLRLSLGFAPPAVVNGAVGLVTAAVLYRLYYADWYVVLMLAIPGFLYTVLACRLALGFADSLRKVEA